MSVDYSSILKHLERFCDFLDTGKMTLNDIPVATIEQLLNASLCNNEEYGNRLTESFSQIYTLTQQHGNSAQQKAFLEILINLLKVQSMSEDEKCGVVSKYEACLDIFEKYIENGLSEEYIDSHTWGDIVALKDGRNVDLFWKVSEEIRNKNIERIKKQDKIRIAFFTKDSAEWSTESLYRKLCQDDRYEVYVIVAPFFIGTEITVVDTYNKAVEYFENKGYRTYGMAELDGYELKRIKTWNEIPVPDVVFMLNPHADAFKDSSCITSFPLRMLITYVPYGFCIIGNVHDQYNQLSHQLFWKIFELSDLDLWMSRKYSDIGDRNNVMSGYLKMDEFYRERTWDVDSIWKLSKGKDVKKIIYAPHWSIREAFTGMGNFDKIYDWMYEYAKSHADTTSWIFRPHPMLRAGAVAYGVFKSETEFDEYMKKWDELPNARVVERGEYIDIFATSDAMIMDCGSFMGEYQYMHKPLLFLTRDANVWNDVGLELKKILYTAPGDDTAAIERFIEEVVINGNDTMKDEREAFFDKYLDYKTKNGKLACEYVKDLLDETFAR